MASGRLGLLITVLAAAGLAGRADRAALDPHALFARERAASGGSAWNRVAALRIAGTIVAGGAASPFRTLVDRRNGWSKTLTMVGPIVDVSGFDGVAWDFQGSTVTEQSLPGLRADNVTQAYIARDGWWRRTDPATMRMLAPNGGDDIVRVTPAGGSPVDVWFDRASWLIDRLVAHADSGRVVTRLSDYRAIGNLVTSFRSVEDDPTGAETVTQARSVVALAASGVGALARPRPRFLGRVAGVAPARVPFAFNPRNGWIFVTLRIGSRRAPVIFDSGGANYFVPAAAKRLGLRGSGGLPISGVGNGSVNASLANLGTIALGRAQLLDQHGIIAPLPYGVMHVSAARDVDGLVGAEFLQNLRTSFDFGANTASFEPFARPFARPPGTVIVPMLSDGSHAYVRATIDGVAGIFLLDTGDDGDITIFRRFADAHGLFRGTGLRYLSPGGVGGTLAVVRYRAHSFALGGGIFTGPPVTVSSATAGSFASRSVAGNIGIRILSRYRVTFDFSRKLIAFVPTAAIALPLHTDRSGMSIDQTDPSSFVVLSTVAGSPAAVAGVKPGDRILAIDGRNVAAQRLGFLDAAPYLGGKRPYALTLRSADGTQRSVTIAPRDLLPRAE